MVRLPLFHALITFPLPVCVGPLQRVGDAPEWVPPEERPRSRSAARAGSVSRAGNNAGAAAASPSEGGGAPVSPGRGGADVEGADADVAAATGARPGTAAAAAAPPADRPPFRPVSSHFSSAAEESRATAFLSVVTADTPPEELAKVAHASLAASTGVARALASPNSRIFKAATGRLDMKLAPLNFLVPAARTGPADRAMGEFIPGDLYETEERTRRAAQVRGPVVVGPLQRARPSTAAGGGGAAEDAGKPFRACGPVAPAPAGPFLTAAATDFEETLAGRLSAARAKSAGPRSRRPGTAASSLPPDGRAAKPDPLLDRPVYNQNTKDVSGGGGGGREEDAWLTYTGYIVPSLTPSFFSPRSWPASR